jgi:glycosyltransferase involved in cell wall biosynthesis
MPAGADSTSVLPVSVLIPAYNRAEMVGRALESVAAQRPAGPAEVIVVDDCSTDATAEVAERLGARVIRHERNMGEGAARNSALAAATQPWLAPLDSDDEWLPHHLATLWALRDGNVLVSGSCLGCTADGRAERFGGTPARGPRPIDSPAELIFPENFVTASGVLLRRDAVEAAGGWRPLPFGADLDLWLRLLEHGPGVITPEVVTIYNLHEGQVTRDLAGTRAHHELLAREYEGRPWWSPDLVERTRAVTAWDTLRLDLSEGRRANALRQAAFIAARPRRAAAVARILARRARLRRRASRSRARRRSPSAS